MRKNMIPLAVAFVLALLALAFALVAGSTRTATAPPPSPAPKTVAGEDWHSRLPPNVAKRLDSLDIETRAKLLGDPVFMFLVKATPPAQQDRFLDGWLDGLSDNFCRELLFEAASGAFDKEGVEKLALPQAQSGCPRGVSLDETINYVNSRLMAAFNDRFTTVLPPRAAEQMINQLIGKEELQGGLGLLFTNSRAPVDVANPALPGKTNANAALNFKFNGLIFHVAKNSPAAAAGLQDGDKVLTADGEELSCLDSDYVIDQKLRGMIGSKVTLKIQRGNDTFVRTLTRAVVKPDAVWSRSLGNGIYAIVITRWQEAVSTGIYSEIKSVMAAGAKGIVIDVRNNGGGELDEAVIAAAMRVRDGVLVSLRERASNGDPQRFTYQTTRYEMRAGKLFAVITDESTGKSTEQPVEIELTKKNEQTGKFEKVGLADIYVQDMPPVVVLGNEGTASASEIYIGSLYKNKVENAELSQGATFVGRPTHGKGIEQYNNPLALGMRMSITFGRVYQNDGHWAGDAADHRFPLTPDITVDQPDDALLYTSDDKQLQAGVDYLLAHPRPIVWQAPRQ